MTPGDMTPGDKESLAGRLDELLEKVDRAISHGSIFPEQPSNKNNHYTEFEQRYLALINKEYDRLKLIGVRMRDIPLKTRIAFVSLDLRRGAESEPCPAETALVSAPSLTVRGPAGSGKSTLLRWVALQCAEVQVADNPWRFGIPFFIPLRILAGQERGRPEVSHFVDYTLRPPDYA